MRKTTQRGVVAASLGLVLWLPALPQSATTKLRLDQYVDRALTAPEVDLLSKEIEQPASARGPFAEQGRAERVLEMRSKGRTVFALVAVARTLEHPGSDSVFINLYEKNGNLIGKSRFSSGKRIYFSRVQKQRAPTKSQDLIAIDMHPVTLPPRFRREYYALDSGRFQLVRLEDGKGSFVANDSWSEVGPDPFVGVADEDLSQEVVRKLRRGSWTQKIATLTWLTGQATQIGKATPVGRCDERVANEQQGTYALITEIRRLTLSRDQWMKEAAQGALESQTRSVAAANLDGWATALRHQLSLQDLGQRYLSGHQERERLPIF